MAIEQLAAFARVGAAGLGSAGIGRAGAAMTAETPAATAGNPAGSFADALGGMLDGVEQTAGDANTAVGHMLDKTGDVHDAMIALQRAEMALQMTVQVRNKLVSAYQEVMRMPI